MTVSERFGSSSTISTLCNYQVLLKIVKLMCGSVRFFPFWLMLCASYAERWNSTKSLKVARKLEKGAQIDDYDDVFGQD